MTNKEISDISQLNLSKRVYNALSRNGIYTIDVLATLSDEQLLGIRGFGQSALAEVHEKLTTPLSCSDSNRSQKDTVLQQPPIPSKEKILATLSIHHPLEELGLSIRPRNALKRAGIHTIEHLVLLSDEELLEVRNIGTNSFEIIRNSLKLYLDHHPLPEKYVELSEQYKLCRSKQLSLTLQRDGSLPTHPTYLINPALFDRASCLPLDEISINRLALSEQLQRELLYHQVESVGDLDRQFASEFKHGDSIREQVEWYIKWLLTQPEKVWEEEIEGYGISPVYKVALEENPLDAFIANWFTVLSHREQQIIYRRYGLQGDLLTLEQLGEQFGVTRERVRQLQKRAERKLKRTENLQKIKPLVELFHYVLTESGGPMNAQQFRERLCDVLVAGEMDPLNLANLVFELNDSCTRLKNLYGWDSEEISLTQVVEIQEQLATLLDQEKVPLTTAQLITKFKDTRFYQENSDEFGETTIEGCLESHPGLRLKGKLWYLKKRSWLRLAGIILALRQIGEPAHYEVIAERTNALLPSNLHRTPHSIHAELGRRPDIFIRVGHGVFGLEEWGLVDDGSVANAAHRVLTEAGKPLHYEVIIDHVLETWKVNPGSVYAALSVDERFINIGSGIYWVCDRALPEAGMDFGDLFGAKLARRQKEIEHWDNGIEYDTHDEVDFIRDMGTDFFGG